MPGRLAGIGFAVGLLTCVMAAQTSMAPDFEAMADAEREFAKAATVKGWRDAFLDFFADDAIAFAPAVTNAKERLRKQPSTPFSEFELIWEPRTGDVAASGDLGWLTGPSTSLNRKDPEPKPGYGCYLSVWRKQPDGRWKVFIDVGASAPAPVEFAPGLTRTAAEKRWVGKESRDTSTQSLALADRDLNAAVAADGPAKAFGTRVTALSRLHHPGFSPLVGRDAIVGWLEQNATAAVARDTSAESAASGDVGYTFGTFETTAPKPIAGVYVRLWSRDADGKWWVMADVAQPFKPK